MKKKLFLLLSAMILPIALLFSGCQIKTEYVAPAVTEEVVITSDLTQATNLAALSTVAIVAETDTGYSAGAGVVYYINDSDTEGYIITNYHVIANGNYFSGDISNNIYAQPYGSEYCYVDSSSFASNLVMGNNVLSCEYIGGTQEYDIAVLKINGHQLSEYGLKAVTVAKSTPKLGSTVIAIGNPNFEGLSATRGIISVESEPIEVSVNESTKPGLQQKYISYRAIRFDAAINPGNSGGGLYNEKGELIGIPSAGAEDSEDYSNAIPVSVAVGVAENILNTYKNYTNLTGLYLFDSGLKYDGENSKAVYEESTGLTFIKEDIIVTDVGTLFASTGISKGDKIISVEKDGNKIELSRAFELDDFMLTVYEGSTFTITYMNGNGANDIIITASKSYFSIIK